MPSVLLKNVIMGNLRRPIRDSAITDSIDFVSDTVIVNVVIIIVIVLLVLLLTRHRFVFYVYWHNCIPQSQGFGLNFCRLLSCISTAMLTCDIDTGILSVRLSVTCQNCIEMA